MSEIKSIFEDGDMVLWKRKDGTHLCDVKITHLSKDEGGGGYMTIQGDDEDVAWGIFNLDGTPPNNNPNQYQSPHISLELVPRPTLFGEPFKYPTE